MPAGTTGFGACILSRQGEVQCEQGGQHDHPGHCSAGHAGQGHQHLCDARAGVVQLALSGAG